MHACMDKCLFTCLKMVRQPGKQLQVLQKRTGFTHIAKHTRATQNVNLIVLQQCWLIPTRWILWFYILVLTTYIRPKYDIVVTIDQSYSFNIFFLKGMNTKCVK